MVFAQPHALRRLVRAGTVAGGVESCGDHDLSLARNP